MKQRIAIAGAGFSGAVLARELAESGRFELDVFDERPHIAGNCHTARDPETDVMVHQYGPHIFNTSREDVWQYVNRYGDFVPYVNRVKAVTARGVFSLPINLLTINQFFNKNFSPAEAKIFVEGLGDRSIVEPANLEEQALRFLGRDLYLNFFRGYTLKQWGVDPRELPASILQRLPVRFTYDDNYYNQRYQGMPRDGYTAIVSRLLDHPAIHVHLNRRFERRERSEYDHLFYSGPIDSYFNFELGRLRYRSLSFEKINATGDYQGNAVINYCQESIPWTRIAEHKHFAPWENHTGTTCYREFSKLAEPGDTPYYPLRLAQDNALLERYCSLAESEDKLTFIGRLGTYRYLDMHVVIGESLDLARQCLAEKETRSWPTFSHAPLEGHGTPAKGAKVGGMNIAVTGGAGYIGSHAVRALIRAGHNVLVLDNFSHGFPQAVDPAARLVRVNAGDAQAVAPLLQDHKTEAVLHFAAFIEVGESMADPLKYYENNFAQGIGLLKALREAGVRRLVFSSTAAVYGQPEAVPILETHALRPINPYGRAKWMFELALADAAAAFGLGYVALRYFNVAGASPDAVIGEAHVPESHLIPRILAAAADPSQAVTIFGEDYPTPDGTCVRDFVHVEDLVQAHLLALQAILPGTGKIYNLGSQKGFSVREVIQACENVCGQTLRVEHKPRRPGDPPILVASSDKIKTELGWAPRYPRLETMIEHAWIWHSRYPLGYQESPLETTTR